MGSPEEKLDKTDEHVKKFFEMFPNANPTYYPERFKYYIRLYKWLHSQNMI